MGKSLEEYARLHPQPEPDQRAMEETARTYNDRQQEREIVEQLKASILRQLEQGNEPQIILYTALKAIGILTQDAQWAADGQEILDKVYSDLAQESLLTDNAATAAARLDTMQATYNEKLRRQLKSQLNGYKRIEKALQEALQAVNTMEP